MVVVYMRSMHNSQVQLATSLRATHLHYTQRETSGVLYVDSCLGVHTS